MSRKLKWASIVSAVATTLLTISIISSPAIQRGKPALELTFAGLKSNGDLQCFVTLSNACTTPLNYRGGFGTAWYTKAYKIDNEWHTNRVQTPGGGDAVLPPNGVIVERIELPAGTTAAMVGLDYTRLSWRGKLAWRMAAGPLRGISGVPASLLLGEDARRGRDFIWSSVLVLVRTNDVQLNAN